MDLVMMGVQGVCEIISGINLRGQSRRTRISCQLIDGALTNEKFLSIENGIAKMYKALASDVPVTSICNISANFSELYGEGCGEYEKFPELLERKQLTESTARLGGSVQNSFSVIVRFDRGAARRRIHLVKRLNAKNELYGEYQYFDADLELILDVEYRIEEKNVFRNNEKTGFV